MFTKLSELLARKPVILQLLRFACIGALNTAIDFVILNLLTHHFGIEGGSGLAYINVVGVTAAIVQSYYWNKYWAFAEDAAVSVLRQFVGVLLVGGLGFCAFVAAVLPSVSEALASRGVPAVQASSFYYGLVLLVFLLLQVILAVHIGFHKKEDVAGGGAQFGKFILISVIGVVINSVVLTSLAALILHVSPAVAVSFAKNVAKLMAVFVTLSWNFVGYKFFVFKR